MSAMSPNAFLHSFSHEICGGSSHKRITMMFACGGFTRCKALLMTPTLAHLFLNNPAEEDPDRKNLTDLPEDNEWLSWDSASVYQVPEPPS